MRNSTMSFDITKTYSPKDTVLHDGVVYESTDYLLTGCIPPGNGWKRPTDECDCPCHKDPSITHIDACCDRTYEQF